MITPVVQEAEWMSLCPDLPRGQPSEKPTVVVSPHPDDETLGRDGLIARLRSKGIDVTVIAVTDGENAYEDGSGTRNGILNSWSQFTCRGGHWDRMSTSIQTHFDITYAGK